MDPWYRDRARKLGHYMLINGAFYLLPIMWPRLYLLVAMGLGAAWAAFWPEHWKWCEPSRFIVYWALRWQPFTIGKIIVLSVAYTAMVVSAPLFALVAMELTFKHAVPVVLVPAYIYMGGCFFTLWHGDGGGRPKGRLALGLGKKIAELVEAVRAVHGAPRIPAGAQG